MSENCTIQLFADGVWHDAGTVTLLGDEAQGWRARSYTGYAAQWAIDHAGARGARAFACRFPVGLQPFEQAHWPPFLVDMLPQGFGRAEILRQMGLPATAAESADWPLLMAGAGNPVGNLRVKEAAERLGRDHDPIRGFTDDEVAQRGDDFAEYLASRGLFIAGSSGVQGDWPKVLLTRAEDGLLYLDHSLPDGRAREHFIVKFGQGRQPELASILRHEAAYMSLAQGLGLRVHAPLSLRESALLIPRFDRRVGKAGVVRLAQESIATLTGMPGFDAVPSHDVVCRHLLRHCTDPAAEALEYLKRDVANLALGNKDNHARNTALQRDFAGNIRLAPLYDFAPMYLHPDGIARRIRWEGNDDGRPDWEKVIDTVCEMAGLEREPLIQGLRAMIAPLRDILAHGTTLGLEPEVHDHLSPGIGAQLQRLEALR